MARSAGSERSDRTGTGLSRFNTDALRALVARRAARIFGSELVNLGGGATLGGGSQAAKPAAPTVTTEKPAPAPAPKTPALLHVGVAIGAVLFVVGLILLARKYKLIDADWA